MNEITLTEERLSILLDKAAESGARKALHEIGLRDDRARADIEDMRSLLAAWRNTRSTMWRTILQACTMAMIGFISIAVWTHFKYQIK